MNIDEMEAGRELDALVAERVMGWKFIPLPKRNRSGLCINCGRAVWDDPRNRQTELGICNEEDCRYSTDIAAAWLVEERIAELGLIDEYCIELNAIANAHWDDGKRQPQRWQLIHATPEDRCRAALKAVEK
jgi:hypothetical protein